ncbi:hypothetical protein [Shumkonia mesophila]|uniref:hypothetical protein n=1 Tax=Shumkonia mesophila TaxID=2838854 RepID=UPI0029347150|nr:hypothetical protein [Shumkonia mesophila]
MVTAPYTPKEFTEVTVQVPIVRRRLEPAEVTWLRDADGWWWLAVNGENVMALSPDKAGKLAGDVLAAAAPPKPDPVPEVR